MKTQIFFIGGSVLSLSECQEKITKIESVGGKIVGPVQFLINNNGYREFLITANIPNDVVVRE